MAIRIKWDQYEAALLIEAFWKIEQTPNKKKEIIKQLSADLRKKALNAGLEIDDVFRNENGISMQLAPIGHAFFPERATLTSSALFERMVAMYRNNRTAYEEILQDAKCLVVGEVRKMDNKLNFEKWLENYSGRIGFPTLQIISAMSEASDYCVSRKLCKVSFWDMNSVDEFNVVSKKLQSAKLFRFLHKGTANILLKAVPLYKEYLLHCASEKQTAEAEQEIQTNNDRPLTEAESSAESQIEETLLAHFNYGFNISSPIELMRFKNYYHGDHEVECLLSDELIISTVKSIGFEFDGKVYVVPQEAFSRIKEIIDENAQSGAMILYYEEFFNLNEAWLYDAHIHSSDMLKQVILYKVPECQCRTNYLILNGKKTNELDAIKLELGRVWGESVLQTFDELSGKLPFIPLEKIKYSLSYGEKFFWNSFETYANIDLFKINENQIQLIKTTASKLCDENGSFILEELPISDIYGENYELSETAFYDIIFSFISEAYSRNSKVVSRKGEAVDATTAIVRYCGTRQSCTMDELEMIMKEKTGEVRYPVVIEAGNAAMTRIDLNQFVSDDKVQFLVDEIDTVLDSIVLDEFIGLKEITALGAFPYCGYAWNLYLIESFCRRFSKKYRYMCITPNSKNAGVILKKSCQLAYHEIMAKAVARSNVELNEKEVFDFLVSAGYMIRRQYSNMKELLELATSLRERRD